MHAGTIARERNAHLANRGSGRQVGTSSNAANSKPHRSATLPAQLVMRYTRYGISERSLSGSVTTTCAVRMSTRRSSQKRLSVRFTVSRVVPIMFAIS